MWRWFDKVETRLQMSFNAPELGRANIRCQSFSGIINAGNAPIESHFDDLVAFCNRATQKWIFSHNRFRTKLALAVMR